MGWVRLDDKFAEHPKVAAAGPFGLALYVAGIAYCNRNLTDGFIPRSVAATLLDDEWTDSEGLIWKAAAHSGFQGFDFDCIAIADHLVHVGLFHVTRYGYRIHDYEQYQPSKKEVLESREKTSERVRKHRERRMNAKESLVDGNAGGNAVTNVPVTAPPTPTPREVAKATSGERASDELWDTLVQELGDVETKSERGKRNAAVKELRDVGAMPEDIRQRCAAYRQKWPHLTLTATALTAHWSSLVLVKRPQNNAHAEVDLDLPEISEEERLANLKRLKAMTA